jgi:Tetratricopeptide repeat
MAYIARELEAAGRTDEALLMQERVFEAMCGILGDEHPDVLDAQQWLVKLLVALGRPREAMPLVNHIVAVRTSHLGADHPSTQAAEAWRRRVERDLGEAS